MPTERRTTRQTSKKSQESDDQTDSFDDCPSQDDNRTVRESEAQYPTMEEELLQLRKQLEAAKAAASKEKQERLRYEQLLQEQQIISSVLPNSAVTSSAPKITTVTSAVFTPVFATSTATTVPHAVSQDNLIFQQTAATGHMPCTSHAAYSWPPVTSAPSPQITPASSAYRQQSSTPTFLQPLNGLQTMQRQYPIPSSAAEQPQHAHGPSLPPAAYGSQRKPHDLPEFRGRPEEWPMFCTAFVESTNMFGYSKVENMFRLHKSLKGEARDVVESLLIHPNNVDEVMASLEFRFGRPECLVQSQLKKVRGFMPIPDNKLELIVPFATKVQNLTVFLEASGMHQHLANPTLLDELVLKLPMNKRLEWAQCSVCIRPYPTIKHFSEWMNRVARLVCIVTSTQLSSSSQSDSSRRTTRGNVLHAVEVKEKVGNSKCRYCEGTSHAVTGCSSFTKLDTPAKWDFVKRHNLCFGCLKFGHNIRTCRTKRSCGIADCQRMHHQSLHESESPSKSSAGESVGLEPRRPLLSCDDAKNARILFRVLPIRIYNKEAMVRTFALLDEGSSVTIMSSELAKRLRLSGKPKDLHLRWIGDKPETKKSFAVDVEVSADQDDAKKFKLNEVQTVEELRLPTQTFANSGLFLHSRPDISLPNYNNARPEILIGLDNSHLGAPIEVVNIQENGPITVRTQLGWVAYGALPSGQGEDPRGNVVLCSNHACERDARLDKLVEEYFCIESFGVKKPKEKPVSQSDKRASHLLSSTTKRLDKRYQTGLLWKEDGAQLPNSYELAKKRLYNLEGRMRRDPDFSATYKNNVASYVKKGYAVKLTSSEAGSLTPRTWYLPHFGVKNPNKPGKVRLVFDAAAEVEGISLNSALLKGPDNYVPLVKVLFNFRIRPVAVTGDIREMFHQVLIRPEDEHSQRFLWREEEGMPVDTYVMKVMTFGAACSPCSANYIKNLNAERFRNEHPRATEAIVNHHYVDDYVDSFESVSEAITVTKTVVDIHRDAGFELRNFTSNSKEVLHSLSNAAETCSSIKTISLDMEAAMNDKVLGLCWNSEEDVFMFRLNFGRVNQDIITGNRCPTKREFLSLTMSVFDPLGMIL